MGWSIVCSLMAHYKQVASISPRGGPLHSVVMDVHERLQQACVPHHALLATHHRLRDEQKAVKERMDKYAELLAEGAMD